MALNKALSLNPQAAISYHSKAIVLHKLRRYQEAIEACDAALKINPQFLPASAKKAHIINDMVL